MKPNLARALQTCSAVIAFAGAAAVLAQIAAGMIFVQVFASVIAQMLG